MPHATPARATTLHTTLRATAPATAATCTCHDCVGAACTCGCQGAPTGEALATVAAGRCACGPGCACGPSCACVA